MVDKALTLMPTTVLASRLAYGLFKYGLHGLCLGFVGVVWMMLMSSGSNDLGGGLAFGCIWTAGIGSYFILARRFLKTLDREVEIVPGQLRIVSGTGERSDVPLDESMEIKIIRKPRLSYCEIEQGGRLIARFLPTNDLLEDLRHPGPQQHWQWLMERYLEPHRTAA